MHAILNENLFLVKQHIGMFKAANNFDIYNPTNSEQIMKCREEKLGFWTKLFRFTKYKVLTPFHAEIYCMNNTPIVSLKRGTSLGFSPISIFDENNVQIGNLKPKFRIGGAKIEINNSQNDNIATLTGNLLGWDFKIKKDNIEIATVTKKWAGIGKELFTSADNYILSINENVGKNDPIRPLLISSVLCIDFLLKNN
jgi:uncharacterized protein YxjI